MNSWLDHDGLFPKKTMASTSHTQTMLANFNKKMKRHRSNEKHGHPQTNYTDDVAGSRDFWDIIHKCTTFSIKNSFSSWMHLKLHGIGDSRAQVGPYTLTPTHLTDDVSVGEADDHPVLGCVVFVLVLDNQAFAGKVVSFSLCDEKQQRYAFMH